MRTNDYTHLAAKAKTCEPNHVCKGGIQIQYERTRNTTWCDHDDVIAEVEQGFEHAHDSEDQKIAKIKGGRNMVKGR